MKKTHIAFIVLIAVAIGAIIATFTNAGTYATFPAAETQPGKTFTVIGQLNLEAEMDFNARQNLFRFVAQDKDGNERTVYYNQPKPQDFERAEEITMKGFATDTAFIASEILMKCPSKYNDQNQVADVTE
ncbi:MAG: cytochrome c maturation protein CcmE [Schleiferiaceae bacterium]|nr:cytochrome c maturation protein CcmE [Schleiferiaceae bacterium]